MILVDTSIWIAVFAKHRPLPLEKALDFEEVSTILPVVQEVLQGFRAEGAYRTARDALLSLPIVESPMEESLFLEAANLYRAARHRRLAVRSSTDCLIAACALRHDRDVLQRDRDCQLLSAVSGLKCRTA